MHLGIEKRANPEKLLNCEDILTRSSSDLRGTEVLIQHGFDLKHDNSICHHPRCLSPGYNKVVKSTVNEMLEAGVIVPAT